MNRDAFSNLFLRRRAGVVGWVSFFFLTTGRGWLNESGQRHQKRSDKSAGESAGRIGREVEVALRRPSRRQQDDTATTRKKTTMEESSVGGGRWEVGGGRL